MSAEWVSRFLTVDSLALLRRNPDALLRRNITIDETRIHHKTPEAKQVSADELTSKMTEK